ncbi:MAG TPA: nucleotidyltransferase domain-containing protein [bacterium]|nr:nucleotidyltransferase domain-containing protein [bacterium]HPN42727.1 nucleotidyltransferase domain-containing protein [bacterium]
MNKKIDKIIRDFVTDSRRLLKDNLIGQYLFGSYTQNKQTKMSDIDILIIVKAFNMDIRRQISALSSQYSIDNGIVISPVLKDIRVWEMNKKHNTQFYKEICKYGVLLGSINCRMPNT